MSLSNIDKKAMEQWKLKCREISKATKKSNAVESIKDIEKRILRAKNDYNYFVTYYFPHYAKSDCGYFHIDAAKEILKNKNIFAVLEWAREHAKSVHADIFIPLWLKIHGELDGMILVGKSDTDACKLLSDVQAELQNNQRYIADFGEQFSYGSWAEGDFTTQDGVNFIALGRGQSPRGVRNQEKRPNYGVVDDIDDDEMVRNPKRVDDIVKWLLSAFYGALSIKGARFVMVGNRIHKNSVLANIVGDVDADTPKRANIYHSKVCAINAKTGQPEWKENFTIEELQLKISTMGYALSQKEYFHNAIVVGKVFKTEWINWIDPLPLHKYENLILYLDPSFKNTSKSDYKAFSLIGRTGTQYHILKAFCRQCSVAEMVRALYDMYEYLNPSILNKYTTKRDVACMFYIEANFLQDLLFDDIEAEGLKRGYQLPISGDKRAKPNKQSRIEAMSPLWERGFVFYSNTERKNKDMQTGIEQTLAFEPGSNTHDDFPDCNEGGLFKLRSYGRQQTQTRLLGTRELGESRY